MTAPLAGTVTSGECVDCGFPIGELRRRALPNAIRCVGCQNLVERPRGKREKSL